jgi:hypothetical protein
MGIYLLLETLYLLERRMMDGLVDGRVEYGIFVYKAKQIKTIVNRLLLQNNPNNYNTLGNNC